MVWPWPEWPDRLDPVLLVHALYIVIIITVVKYVQYYPFDLHKAWSPAFLLHASYVTKPGKLFLELSCSQQPLKDSLLSQ